LVIVVVRLLGLLFYPIIHVLGLEDLRYGVYTYLVSNPLSHFHCAQWSLAYAGVVFWFWFWFCINILMIVSDVAWWVVAMRLANRRLWRILVSVFMGGQLVAHLSAMAGSEWPSHVPKAVFLSAVVWHYVALGLAFAVLLPLGIARAWAWIIRRIARVRGVQRNRPVAATSNVNSTTRREFIGAVAALAPPLFTVGLTGVAVAQLSHFRVRLLTLSVPTLPRALDGITIAHVTDVHVGGVTSARVLRQMVNTTNALRADLVLLTGDLINYELADLSEGIALVKAMEGRYGLWTIEGNHDLAVDGGEFERRVKAAGVPLLLDESAIANVRGYPVQVFGLRWIDGGGGQRDRVTALQVRDVLKQRHPDAFPILLAHHPHAFDAAVKVDLPLTLAGHTHGGECMLDSQHGIGPVMFRYWSGLYTRGRSQLVVSNGVGNWLPIRINAPAEIVHLTLRRAENRG
jgi:predicted MPP superfamily phosphohydrolase